MKFLENWKDVLKKAWSVRLIALAFFLTALEYIIPTYPVPEWVIMLTIASAFVARLLAQQNMSKKIEEKN